LSAEILTFSEVVKKNILLCILIKCPKPCMHTYSNNNKPVQSLVNYKLTEL